MRLLSLAKAGPGKYQNVLEGELGGREWRLKTRLREIKHNGRVCDCIGMKPPEQAKLAGAGSSGMVPGRRPTGRSTWELGVARLRKPIRSAQNDALSHACKG